MTFNTIDKPINCNNPHLLAVVQVLPSQVIAAARFSLLLIILIDRCLLLDYGTIYSSCGFRASYILAQISALVLD
jgi:hypothetical protein